MSGQEIFFTSLISIHLQNSIFYQAKMSLFIKHTSNSTDRIQNPPKSLRLSLDCSTIISSGLVENESLVQALHGNYSAFLMPVLPLAPLRFTPYHSHCSQNQSLGWSCCKAPRYCIPYRQAVPCCSQRLCWSQFSCVH